MKECPNCKELLGDSVNICFNCYYDFSLKRVVNTDEINQERLKQEKIRKENILKQEKIAKQELLIKQEFKKSKEIQLSKNPLYEYKVEYVNDNPDGTANFPLIQQILNSYSERGWKLQTAFTNEVGKISSSVAVAFLGSSVNATIDQTILIFERCIKA